MQVPCYVCNDAVAALAAGTNGRPEGIVLIAGTGSIAFGALGGVSVRASGWGAAFGDAGSGYDLGQRALCAAAQAVDGRGRPTALVEALPSFLALADMPAVARWVYEDSSWARIASLAPVVMQAAHSGASLSSPRSDRVCRQ